MKNNTRGLNRFLCSAAGILMALFVVGLDQSFGAGYEFEGVGARQVSRAGAVIADSNDWTSIYWNPGSIAGTVQNTGREVGIEVFGGEINAKDSNSLSKLYGPIFKKERVHSNFILGAVGALLPIGKKGGIGFGMYTPIIQGVKFKDTSPTTGISLDTEGSLAIITWNVSGSYLITPQVSAGAGINLLYGRLKSRTVLDTPANPFVPAPANTAIAHQDGNGMNVEGIIGLRYNPTPQWSFGGVYRSGSDVNVKGSLKVDNSALPREQSDFTYELRHPATWGIGTAYRMTPKLTLSLDYNRTLWHRFVSNNVFSTPDLMLIQNTPDSFKWRDSWKIRLGAQYKVTEKTDLLAGYAHDTFAFDADSVDLSTTIDVNKHIVTGGVAHRFSPKIETIAGIMGSTGEREQGGVKYRLSGYELMLENRFFF